MLTGQDAAALEAIAATWKLYALADVDGRHAALQAIALLVGAMQPKCRAFARELIPWAMDWSDRDPLWSVVELHSFKQATG